MPIWIGIGVRLHARILSGAASMEMMRSPSQPGESSFGLMHDYPLAAAEHSCLLLERDECRVAQGPVHLDLGPFNEFLQLAELWTRNLHVELERCRDRVWHAWALL